MIGIHKNKKGIGPAMVAVLLAGVGWLLVKLIIGAKVAWLLDKTVLIILGAIAFIVFMAFQGRKR